jgi:hypothetical protein
MEMSGKFHTSAALPTVKMSTVTFAQEAGWAQSRYEPCGVEKNLFPFVGNRTLVVQPVACHFTD